MVSRVDPDRYDVMHHHAGAWPRALAADSRVVRTLHFCVAAKMENYVRIGRLKTLARPGNWIAVAGERRDARAPVRLIAVAERVRRDFARFHGVDPARSVVIPNGARFAAPGIDRAALRARHGIAADVPMLLTIGRPDFVKGHDLLRRAWARARAAAPSAVWVSVGGEAASREGDRVVTGPVPAEEVVDWIHAADLGALPSYYEGCSVALLEMLAGNLYTLAHDVGNAAEVIRPRENGEVVPVREGAWTEALTRLMESPPPRPAQGLPKEFRWDALAARVEAVYRGTPAR
jgi:glycosyltransferase involved in cell wall biosynthesis